MAIIAVIFIYIHVNDLSLRLIKTLTHYPDHILPQIKMHFA